MAVSINTVYQTVLYILNKEQRGYIPPAEFNSLAAQVQTEIFESYFPDGNQLNRQNQKNTQNDTEFFNMFKDTAYKLFPFERNAAFTYNSANLGFIYSGGGIIYKLGDIISTYAGNPIYNSVTELVSQSDFNKITRSKLTIPTVQYPLAVTTQTTTLVAPSLVQQLLVKVTPFVTGMTLNINCLFAPTNPSWGFSPGGQGQYIYDASISTDFQLDVSEKNNLIINILKYAGVIINDPTIIQVASQEAQQASINEKS
tara:strand:+ start:849 stop:1616 length:768 start_codon:yes stop_codon:yes gene_type:complete